MAKLVIFVHGLGANVETFWGSTPEALKGHPDISDFEIKFWGYKTTQHPIPFFQKIPGISQKHETLEQLGQHLWSKIRYWSTQDNYTSIRLLGHSMGGLVVAAAIGYALDPERSYQGDENLLKTVKGIAFVGTPLGGANLTKITEPIFTIFGENVHVKDLGVNSVSRKKIVNKFINLALGNHRRIPLKVFRASYDQAVRHEETVSPLPKDSYEEDILEGGHSDCIKNLVVGSDNLKMIVEWINPRRLNSSIEKISTVDNQLIESINRDLEHIKSAMNYLANVDEEQKEEIDFISEEIKNINSINKRIRSLQERAQSIIRVILPYLQKKLEELNSDAYSYLCREEKEHIQEQIDFFSQFVEKLEAGKRIAKWLDQEIELISKEISDYAITKHSNEGNNISSAVKEDVYFSVEQLIELVSHCLKWRRLNALEFPEVPLVVDIEVYRTALSRMKSEDMRPSFIIESEYRYLGEYIEYLIEKLNRCPQLY